MASETKRSSGNKKSRLELKMQECSSLHQFRSVHLESEGKRGGQTEAEPHGVRCVASRGGATSRRGSFCSESFSLCFYSDMLAGEGCRVYKNAANRGPSHNDPADTPTHFARSVPGGFVGSLRHPFNCAPESGKRSWTPCRPLLSYGQGTAEGGQEGSILLGREIKRKQEQEKQRKQKKKHKR